MSNNIVNQFNEILSSFLIQLSPLIGTTYNYKFEQIVKINSKTVIESFLVYALPVRDKIINKDETYFETNEDYKTKLNSDTISINDIINLKDIYKTLDIESKENIWDIIRALLELGDQYLILNKDKFR
jgi:hypothetical protein